MYSNDNVLDVGKEEKHWPKDGDIHEKQFVRSICPKCSLYHDVYMLWTGRGLPRKFCGQCKTLVSGYDEMVICEPSLFISGKSRTKGKLCERE